MELVLGGDLSGLTDGDADDDVADEEKRKRLWGGKVLGLNPNIRVYRYTEGQFFDKHCMSISSPILCQLRFPFFRKSSFSGISLTFLQKMTTQICSSFQPPQELPFQPVLHGPSFSTFRHAMAARRSFTQNPHQTSLGNPSCRLRSL